MGVLVVALVTTSLMLGEGDLTGAATTYVHYTECVDHGNYIVMKNDDGWAKIKRDRCTGYDDRYLERVACVEIPAFGYYTFKYAEVAYCASGAGCTMDDNDAGYCPGDPEFPEEGYVVIFDDDGNLLE